MSQYKVAVAKLAPPEFVFTQVSIGDLPSSWMDCFVIRVKKNA